MASYHFALIGQPKSHQGGGGQESPFVKQLRSQGARVQVQNRTPNHSREALGARIFWFFNPRIHRPGNQVPDLDNIAKPILDALMGLVYDEDFYFYEVYLQKIPNSFWVEISEEKMPGMPDWALKKILSAIGNRKDVVYIQIGTFGESSLVRTMMMEEFK